MEKAEGKSVQVTAPPLTPEQQQVQNLLRKLMEQDTMLILKVATCKCNDKEECAVFVKAREIATTLGKLQELREKGVAIGGSEGRG